MCTLKRFSLCVALLICSCFFLFYSMPQIAAQDYGSIEYKIVSDAAIYRISIPKDWSYGPEEQFTQVFTSESGEAYCTLKRTEDWSFAILSNDEFVANFLADPTFLQKMLPLQYENGQILMLDRFPLNQKTGILTVIKGTMNNQEVVSATYQVTNDGALFTLSCFTLVDSFGYYHPIFASIAGSLTFPHLTK